MKNLITFLVITLFFPSLTSADRGVKRIQDNTKRYALVIGNGAYKSSPLKNPVNDARDISQALKKFGFQVTYKKNAGRQTMENAVTNFWKKLRKGGVGLFYFAGHGIQVKGINYLIPVDAKIESEADIKFKSVNAGWILGKMEDAGNEVNIIILDACRNNPFGRNFRSSKQGLAQMDAPKGSLIAYATGPGHTAADGKRKNGLFTEYLLKHIKTPGITVEQVLKNVRVDVINDTKDQQIPWVSTSMTGNFYFAGGSTEIIEPQQPSVEQLKPKYADLTIRANVPAAVVYFDNIKMGKTPLKISRISAGRHFVKVIADGYKDEQKTINFSSGESRKKKFILDKITPSYSTPSASEINSDRRFTAYDDGTVLDTKTGLMWAAKDNGKDINWKNAKKYCENYQGGGYSDWRMPAIDELEELYDGNAAGYESECGLHVYLRTKLIHLTCYCPWASNTNSSFAPWASNTDSSFAAYFGFLNGGRGEDPQSNSYNSRALPVRRGK